MLRRALAMTLFATFAAAATAVAEGPSKPNLSPLPATVTSVPVALSWSPSGFTAGSVARHYEVRLEDRTDDTTRTVEVQAAGVPGPQTAAVGLADGHEYRLRVRGVETVCEDGGASECEVVGGDFGNERRTRVALIARPAPTPPAPAPVAPAPDPPPPVAAAPVPQQPSPVAAQISTPAVSAASAAAPAAAAPTVARLVRPRTLPRWVSPAISRILDPARRVRLRWRDNRRATFYNVQIFAGRRKILSAFPTAPSLIVRPGLLIRGTLRVVVWSASGPKVAPVFEPRPWVIQSLRAGRPSASAA